MVQMKDKKTISIGDKIKAIKPCYFVGDKTPATIVGKFYKIEDIFEDPYGYVVVIKSELSAKHMIDIDEIEVYFKID